MTWLDGKMCSDTSAKICDTSRYGFGHAKSPSGALPKGNHWYKPTDGKCHADAGQFTNMEVKFFPGTKNMDCEKLQDEIDNNSLHVANLKDLAATVMKAGEKIEILESYLKHPSTLLAVAKSSTRGNLQEMLDAVIWGFKGSAIVKSLKDAGYREKQFGEWKCTRVVAGTARGFLCQASKGSCGLRTCKGMVGTTTPAMRGNPNPIVKQVVCPNFGADEKCRVTKYAVPASPRDSPAKEEERIKAELLKEGTRRRRSVPYTSLSAEAPDARRRRSCRRRAKSCGKVCCKQSTDCPATQSCQGMGKAGWTCIISDSTCQCKDDEGKCSAKGEVSKMKVAASIADSGAIKAKMTCDDIKEGPDRQFFEQVMHF